MEGNKCFFSFFSFSFLDCLFSFVFLFLFYLFVGWFFGSNPKAEKGRNEYGGEPETSLTPIKKRRQTKLLLQGNHEGIPSPR